MRHSAPLYNGRSVRVTDCFGQFFADQPDFGQAIEVKMIEGAVAGLIDATNRKRRAADAIATAKATSQAPYKRRFTTTQVACQLNNLTPLQVPPEPLGELFGLRGTGRACLPGLAGIHTNRILARSRQLSQAE